jgi:hypothetical protein
MDDMSHEDDYIESMLDFEDTLAQQAELEAELWTQEPGAEFDEEQPSLNQEEALPIVFTPPARAPPTTAGTPDASLATHTYICIIRISTQCKHSDTKKKNVQAAGVRTDPCEELRVQESAFRDQNVLKTFGRLSKELKRK